MSRTIVCVDCGHMGTTWPTEYKAPAEDVSGENEFATKMVVQMGFAYLGCPTCKSPNIFFEAGKATMEDEPTYQPTDDNVDDDEEIDVSDMVDEDEEDEEEEEVVETPKPVRKKKKKKNKQKSKVRARRRIGADGQMQTEYVEDTSVDTDDGIEQLEFKRGDPVPRRMYKRECKNPNCNRDFETKHSMQGYCHKCLKGFAGR